MRLLHASIVTLCAAAVSIGNTCAQADYPRKPIRMVLGFVPGGVSDVLARAVGAKLYAAMGQQVLVDNRAGAGTTLGFRPRCQLVAGRLHRCSCRTSRRTRSMRVCTVILPFDSDYGLHADSVGGDDPVDTDGSPLAAGQIADGVDRAGKIETGPDRLRVFGQRQQSCIFRWNASNRWPASTWCTYRTTDRPRDVQALLAGEVAVSFTTMPPALIRW